VARFPVDGRIAGRCRFGTAAESAPMIGIYGSALETRGRVLSLALYLESLQD
jgi:hypothetical protein